MKAPEPEAFGAHPRQALRLYLRVCSWRSQEPHSSRSLRSTGPVDPMLRPPLRRGTSGPHLPSARPVTAPT
eukprot:2906816-Pleurochrysis_carterae.AAC.1